MGLEQSILEVGLDAKSLFRHRGCCCVLLTLLMLTEHHLLLPNKS